MLLQIRDFIKQHGHVSTLQIQREFCLDAAALEPMLMQWAQKGVIELHAKQSCRKVCGGCRSDAENKWSKTEWVSMSSSLQG